MTVTIDCPWCSEPVEVLDEDVAIACQACGLQADLAPDGRASLADAA